MRLQAAKRKIRATACSVGRVRRVHARRSLRGRVVNQSPRPGVFKRQNFPVKLAVGKR
jgi:beta-lactam-binding protein with PASTA domain